MDNKVYKFGYEDTDKKIEIDLYGLRFEILSLDNISDYEDIDKNDVNVVEEQIKRALGEDAIEKINAQREKDGYKPLTIQIELNILGCIFESYAKGNNENVLKRVTNTMNEISEDVDNIREFRTNREYRRNNNYRRNNKNRRRY